MTTDVQKNVCTVSTLQYDVIYTRSQGYRQIRESEECNYTQIPQLLSQKLIRKGDLTFVYNISRHSRYFSAHIKSVHTAFNVSNTIIFARLMIHDTHFE